jgi:hypothetical protein
MQMLPTGQVSSFAEVLKVKVVTYLFQAWIGGSTEHNKEGTVYSWDREQCL